MRLTPTKPLSIQQKKLYDLLLQSDLKLTHIAIIMDLHKITIEFHKNKLFEKFDITNRMDLQKIDFINKTIAYAKLLYSEPTYIIVLIKEVFNIEIEEEFLREKLNNATTNA